MALSESIEKPPIAERAVSPIAVFSNSYARLPEHFFWSGNRMSWRRCFPAM
jgi:hypothetical protein